MPSLRTILFGTTIAAGVMLAGSGLMTVISMHASTQASAQEEAAPAADQSDTGEPSADPRDEELAANLDDDALCVDGDRALELIRKERELLAERRRKIDEEDARLEIGRARLEVDMVSLEELKSEVLVLLEEAEGKHEEDLDRLVTMYGDMRAKEAAGIFNVMELASAVTILSAMPERQAAPILGRIEPQRAQAISRIILDRNRLPADRELPDLSR